MGTFPVGTVVMMNMSAIRADLLMLIVVLFIHGS